MNEAITLAQAIFSLSKVSVVFNISSSHSDTNLPTRRFSQEQFLVSKYSSTLHVYCIYNQAFYDSIYNHFYKNLNHLTRYTHTDIHYDSIFALSYIHFH